MNLKTSCGISPLFAQITSLELKQAEDATTAAQKQCDEMLKKAKAESQAYWDAVSAKITSITNEHAELRQLFSQISAREKDKRNKQIEMPSQELLEAEIKRVRYRKRYNSVLRSTISMM